MDYANYPSELTPGMDEEVEDTNEGINEEDSAGLEDATRIEIANEKYAEAYDQN